jgi:peptide/nickel transport system substrate-binding protein
MTARLKSWRRMAAALSAVAVMMTMGAIGASAAQADSSSPKASPSASPSASPTNTGTDTFRVGVLQDVDNLNVFKGITASAYEMWGLSYQTLTGYSAKDFSVTPELADSWDTSSDGLTWTFHLHPGVKFSDGVPLTSADVVYTFNRIMNGTVEKTNYGSYVKNIDKVTAPDPDTVVFKLKKPTPIMLHLEVPILPEHIWSKISEDALKNYANKPDSTPAGMVGSGPFIMTDAVEGQYYLFKRNPDYTGTPAHIDGIEFRVFQDVNGMVTALKNDEIDFADDIDAQPFAGLENQPNIEARSSEYSGFSYITMNGGAALTNGQPIGTGHPSLKDPRVRLAINYAIDKQALVNRTLDGRGEVGSTIIPPIYSQYHYEPPDPVTYDPDKANQILDDAGYKVDPKTGIRTMPDGSDPLIYHLYSRQNSETSQTTIRYLQGFLKAIHIGSTVQSVSENRLYEIAGEGTYDMYEWGWVVEPDPDYQLSTFTCGQFSYKTSGGTIYAGLNDAFYCNKKYDKLYTEQSTETDVAKRAVIVKKMQKMAYDANAYIVYEYYDYLQAYRTDRFTGFVPQPSPDGAILFQYGIYSYMNIRPVADASSGNGLSAGLVIGVVVGVAVLAGFVTWLVTRGRRNVDADVE